eukprot:15445517-Alexandrium_andersonii.AAC.1
MLASADGWKQSARPSGGERHHRARSTKIPSVPVAAWIWSTTATPVCPGTSIFAPTRVGPSGRAKDAP